MKKIIFIFLVLSCFIFVSKGQQLYVYAPGLKLPANNAVAQLPDVLLDWEAVSGALNYKIQLDTNSGFTNPVILTTTNTAINSSELLFGELYYWRVKAFSASDSSGWSSVWNFTVIDRVTLFSPATGVTNQMPDVLLRWVVLSGVTKYNCQLDTNVNFSGSPFIYTVNATKNDVNADELLFNTQYFWRVRAIHSKDTSDWSLVRSFSTIDSFGLISPANNISALQMPDALLSWDQLHGIDKYEVWADTSSLFNSPALVNMKSDTDFMKADTLHFGEKYYWMVRAYHSQDTTIWTVPWSFNTVDALTLNTPADNAVNQIYNPVFSWQALTGIIKYELCIDTAANFLNSDTIYVNASSGATYTPFYSLLHNKWYYWKVRAISSADTSSWSNAFKFKTGSVGIEEKVNSDNVSVYPNPSSGKLYFDFEGVDANFAYVNITNIVGREVAENTFDISGGKNLHSISLLNLPEGIYLVKIILNGSSFTRRIVLDK